MGPEARSRRTLMIPVPARERMSETGQRSRYCSQPARRSAEGESAPPTTVASVTDSKGARSSVVATSPRQSVTRLHARSVSPGE